MNLVLDALTDVVGDAEQRMNNAGVPRIVREICFVCDGRGVHELQTATGVEIAYCACCASHGYILREAA